MKIKKQLQYTALTLSTTILATIYITHFLTDDKTWIHPPIQNNIWIQTITEYGYPIAVFLLTLAITTTILDFLHNHLKKIYG